MRTAILLLIASSAWGQVTITYSRQHPAILKAYVENAPKEIGLYRAQACNVGTNDALFMPDTVSRLANGFVSFQDPDAALYAGQTAKKNSTKARALDVTMDVLKYGGIGVAVAGTAGIASIPPIVSGIVGGSAVFVPELLKSRNALVQQPLPAKWLTDGMPQRNLRPQQCEAFIFAAVGTVERFEAGVVQAVPLSSRNPPIDPSPLKESDFLFSSNLTATHPQVSDEILYDSARILAMIRERTAERARLGATD